MVTTTISSLKNPPTNLTGTLRIMDRYILLDRPRMTRMDANTENKDIRVIGGHQENNGCQTAPTAENIIYRTSRPEKSHIYSSIGQTYLKTYCINPSDRV